MKAIVEMKSLFGILLELVILGFFSSDFSLNINVTFLIMNMFENNSDSSLNRCTTEPEPSNRLCTARALKCYVE